jgi:hypothetical protein
MASFAYTKYLQQLQAGTFSVPIGSWVSFNLALVLNTYTPAKNTDQTLADIGGGNIAADGMTGTFPQFAVSLNGSGAGAAEIGLRETSLITNKWAAVPLAAHPVNALVLYGLLNVVGPVTLLIAYFDNWGGLGFTPNGTDVTLNSFPTPDLSGGVNLLRLTN